MTFENSEYYKALKPFKLEMPFGNYYFCEFFLVSELHEGIHFDWKKAKKLINEIFKFYGENEKIGFISNRINAHSVDPQNWVKVQKEYNFMAASAIVVYNNLGYMNASLEKHFSKKSIKRCISIEEAIDWIINLDEFESKCLRVELMGDINT